jgi:bacterial/archaeal transporter family-2 protein
MNPGWMIPFIILGGALQTCGAAINGKLYKHMINPWLASAVSFAIVTAFFVAAFIMMPNPRPSAKDLASMPWWAVVGGLVGGVQAYAGFTMVNKIGASTFVGLTVTSALIMSLLIDHFGWLGMDTHPITVGRVVGAACLIAGIFLISRC